MQNTCLLCQQEALCRVLTKAINWSYTNYVGNLVVLQWHIAHWAKPDVTNKSLLNQNQLN